jgi:hypothetical protein
MQKCKSTALFAIKNGMRIIVILIAIATFTACNNGNKGTIPMNKMAKLMAQMQLIDAYASLQVDSAEKQFKNKNLDTLHHYYGRLFKEYAVSENDFSNSYNYYASDYSLLDSLYASIQNELNALDIKEKSRKNKNKR